MLRIQIIKDITLRVLWRNKVTSFVNIFSLTIGITSFILIMLYVHHETSYDKFNDNYHRIYRLEGDDYGKLPPRDRYVRCVVNKSACYWYSL